MRNWTRRSILMGGAIFALPFVGFPAAKLWCWRHGLPRMASSPLTSLVALYPESAAVKKLGERYLGQTGDQALASVRRLQHEKEIVIAAKVGCRVQTLAAIQRACQDDFRMSRVHLIDGWLLAQTELDIAVIQTLA